jgi:hypothetical protein
MGIDGSVQDPIATYSFVISISRTDVKPNVKGGGGFLPPTAQYLELWKFSITIWKQRSAGLHGTDGAISMEQRRKVTANEAATVYQATLGNVSLIDSVVLHHARIDDILKWTKEHLDAYLASATVIIDQSDEPG